MGIKGRHFLCSQDTVMATGEVQPLPVPGKNTAASFPPPSCVSMRQECTLLPHLKLFLLRWP